MSAEFNQKVGRGAYRPLENLVFTRIESKNPPALSFIEPNTINSVIELVDPIAPQVDGLSEKKRKRSTTNLETLGVNNSITYVNKSLTEEIPLKESVEYPNKIKLPSHMLHAFESMRLSAEGSERQHHMYVTTGNYLYGFSRKCPLNPDLENTATFRRYIEEEIGKGSYGKYVGDIQSPTGHFQNEILGYLFYTIPDYDINALSIRQIYRFLSDARQPKFTGKAYYDSNIIAFRTSDTINLTARDEDRFENYWYHYFGFFNRWTGIMNINFTGDLVEDMNYQISERYKFVIYKGKPNEPLHKVA